MLGKAGLLLATCLLYLAPAPAALAQAECGLQSDPGNPETITCDPQDYPGGITYDSLGDLTLQVPDDEVDLRLLDDGVSVTGNGGDNIFWDSSAFVSGDIVGDADLDTFDGAVLDYLSDTGNIDILVGGDIIGRDSASHAIRAESTGGGAVSVTTQGNINGSIGSGASGTGIEALTTTGDISIVTQARVNSGRNGGLYAIHADSSAGGNIEINVSDPVRGANQASHGILAETTGAGNITIDSDLVGFDSIQVSGSSPNAFAGIEAVTGSGDISIIANAQGPNGVVAETGGAGTILLDLGRVVGDTRNDLNANPIRAIADTGDITIDVDRIDFPSGGTAIVTHTNGTATINLMGGITHRVSFSGGVGTTTALRSTGNHVVVNAIGPDDLSPPLGEIDSNTSDGVVISAPFDFGGLTGGAELNFQRGSVWILTDSVSPEGVANSVFSPGDDVVNVAAGAMLVTPPSGIAEHALPVEQSLFTVDFGGGNNVVNNAGTVAVGTQNIFGIERPNDSGEMRLENLAAFNNSGTIWLGAGFRNAIPGTGGIFRESVDGKEKGDLWPDDILSLQGAHFNGLTDGDGNALGRIMVDIDLGRVGQTGCGAEFRVGDSDDLPVADCIDLRDGSAGGRTEVVLLELIPGDRGAYNPEGNVIVDLSGGDMAATDPGAFVVSPETAGYTDGIGNGAIDKGLFFFTIALDPEDEQFKLFGLPSSGAQQFPLLGQAANGLWRTATNAWFDRRVDQRDVGVGSDIGSSAWGRVSRNSGDRDLITPIVGGGETFVFDNGYSQDDITVTIGGDLIFRGAGDAALVVGGMLGYARSELDYDDSRNSVEMEGMHAGLYASLTWNDFYVDVAANQARLDLYNDVPAMDLQPEGTVLDTEVNSTGGQIEAGWRLSLGRLSVEPLAGFSYVKSKLDDISVPADDPTRLGGDVTLSDVDSQRGSLGLRLRMDDVAPGIVPMSVGLTARGIEEFDGESKVVVDNIGPQDALTEDTFDGTFVNVAGDVSITNAAKTVAGFIKVDGTFHDDYDSVGVSAGFRYQW